MTRAMRKTALRLAALAALTLTVGCDTIRATPVARLAGISPAPVDARALLTPSILRQVNLPYLLVIFDDKNTATTFAVKGENPPVRTWFNGDSNSLSITQQGLVVRTAGLGRDLVTADVAQTSIALNNGTSALTRRVHRLLDGNDRVIATPYACQFTPRGPATITMPTGTFATTLTEETCTDNTGRVFMHSYWTDTATGTLRQSRQWISPEIGTLTLQVLHD